VGGQLLAGEPVSGCGLLSAFAVEDPILFFYASAP